MLRHPSPETAGWARISPCGRYRYSLFRAWGDGPSVLFVMLNPSTADALADDPTIRRCIGFTKAWGFSRMAVANLYALRSSDPAALLTAADPVGDENDATIADLARGSSLVVAAWGCHEAAPRRAHVVEGLLPEAACLGLTASGQPRHPLYAPAGARPAPFSAATPKRRGSITTGARTG